MFFHEFQKHGIHKIGKHISNVEMRVPSNISPESIKIFEQLKITESKINNYDLNV
jgi:hypothetical protein